MTYKPLLLLPVFIIIYSFLNGQQQQQQQQIQLKVLPSDTFGNLITNIHSEMQQKAKITISDIRRNSISTLPWFEHGFSYSIKAIADSYGNWQLFSRYQNNLIVPMKFDSIIAIKQKSRWINKKSVFKHSYFAVQLAQKWEILKVSHRERYFSHKQRNSSYEFISNERFDGIGDVVGDLIAVQKNNKWGFFDYQIQDTQMSLPAVFDSMTLINVLLPRRNVDNGYTPRTLNDLLSVQNQMQSFASKILDVSDNYSISSSYLKVMKNGFYGLFKIFDKEISQIVPWEYDDIQLFTYGSEIALAVAKNGKYGLLRTENSTPITVLPLEYENVEKLDGSPHLIFKVLKDGKWGIVMPKRNDNWVISSAEFDDLEYLNATYLKVLIDRKWAIYSIDKGFTAKTEPGSFDKIDRLGPQNYMVTDGQLYGIIGIYEDSLGLVEEIPTNLEKISSLSRDLFKLSRGGLHGVIRIHRIQQSPIITPIKYNEIKIIDTNDRTSQFIIGFVKDYYDIYDQFAAKLDLRGSIEKLVLPKFEYTEKEFLISWIYQFLETDAVAHIEGEHGTLLEILPIKEFLTRLKFGEYGESYGRDFTIKSFSNSKITIKFRSEKLDWPSLLKVK